MATQSLDFLDSGETRFLEGGNYDVELTDGEKPESKPLTEYEH